MFDLVNLAMRRAVDSFGGKSDNVFDGVGFANAFRKLASVESCLDGREVEAILCGRGDVEQLKGGSHYRLVETK